MKSAICVNRVSRRSIRRSSPAPTARTIASTVSRTAGDSPVRPAAPSSAAARLSADSSLTSSRTGTVPRADRHNGGLCVRAVWSWPDSALPRGQPNGGPVTNLSLRAAGLGKRSRLFGRARPRAPSWRVAGGRGYSQATPSTWGTCDRRVRRPSARPGGDGYHGHGHGASARPRRHPGQAGGPRAGDVQRAPLGDAGRSREPSQPRRVETARHTSVRKGIALLTLYQDSARATTPRRSRTRGG